MLYPHENHHGTTLATLCVYDGDYEHCSDFEVVVESVMIHFCDGHASGSRLGSRLPYGDPLW